MLTLQSKSGVCGRCWIEVLAHNNPVPQAPAWHSVSNRTIEARSRVNLEKRSGEGALALDKTRLIGKMDKTHYNRRTPNALMEPTLPAFSSASDLKIYEEHSTIINKLCDELGFKNPATAMAWVFDQLEQSQDLQHAIFKLLED